MFKGGGNIDKEKFIKVIMKLKQNLKLSEE